MLYMKQELIDKVVAHCELMAPSPNLSAYRRVIAQRAKHVDVEACGMIGGLDNVAEKIYPTVNLEASPGLYRISPNEAFRVVKEMRSEGLDLIGCFHSHLWCEAYPSVVDVAQAADSNLVYVIVSLKKAKADIRAFNIYASAPKDEQITEIGVIAS